VNSAGGLDSLEVRVSSRTGHGRRGLVLSHKAGGVVLDAL